MEHCPIEEVLPVEQHNLAQQGSAMDDDLYV